MTPHIVKVALALILAVAHGASAFACDVPAQVAELRAALLTSVNEVRRASGLRPFQHDPRLEVAAQAHACENAGLGRISHRSADGRKLQDRVSQAGYAWGRVAENIAAGQPGVAAVLGDWMNSRPHRRNLLMPALAASGIGIARLPDGRIVWVINMASPKVE